MGMPHEYSRKQLVEIKVTRAGVASWIPAKVLSLSRSGAMVQKTDSHVQGREFHIMFKDMRPVSTQVVQQAREAQRDQLGHARKPTPPAFNPVIPAAMLGTLTEKVKEREPEDALPLSVLGNVPEEDAEEPVLATASAVQESRGYARRATAPTPIGRLIRERREAENLSLKELGKLIDYSAAHLGEIELGFRAPTDDCLRAFADLMSLSYIMLVRLRDSPATTSLALAATSSVDTSITSTAAAPLPPSPPPTPARDESPMPTPAKPAVNAPEALDVFFEFCDKVEEVCPRPRSTTGRVRWRELVKELYQLAKEEA